MLQQARSLERARETQLLLRHLRRLARLPLLPPLTLLLTHPLEFRILLQYKLWYEPKRDISNPSEHETSGWDRPSMRRCWDFLDLTSRSFSGVVKELEGDLARVVSFCSLFRLVRPTSRSGHAQYGWEESCQG